MKYKEFIGKILDIEIDRQYGTKHPNHVKERCIILLNKFTKKNYEKQQLYIQII